MIDVFIFDVATGEVIQTVTTPFPEVIDLESGQAMGRGHIVPGTAYVDGGQVIAMPPRPDGFHVFDYAAKAWVLPEGNATHQARRAEAAAYLADTDWMVIRAAEGGKPVPDDITARRAAARAALSS